MLDVNKTLVTLDISGEEPAVALAIKAQCFVRSPTTLIALLSDNGIETGAAPALATALVANETLMRLNMAQNRLGDGGAQTLSLALLANQTLAAFDVSCKCATCVRAS